MKIGTCQLCGKTMHELWLSTPAKTCIRCTNLTELEGEYLRMGADGNFSWGAVTQYYSSFFAISGLIRLHEVAFVRISSNDYEIQHDTGT
ncbi:MAG: hypothetical protein Q8P28_04665, partial [Deltaproteobacteria bacterium]|nr:hypothetical protein [Deltaproteobacteria bacterium]